MAIKKDNRNSSMSNVATGTAAGAGLAGIVNAKEIKDAATKDTGSHLKHLLEEGERESRSKKSSARLANEYLNKNKHLLKDEKTGREAYRKAQQIANSANTYKFKKYNNLTEIAARGKNVAKAMKGPAAVGGLIGAATLLNESSKGWKS